MKNKEKEKEKKANSVKRNSIIMGNLNHLAVYFIWLCILTLKHLELRSLNQEKTWRAINQDGEIIRF